MISTSPLHRRSSRFVTFTVIPQQSPFETILRPEISDIRQDPVRRKLILIYRQILRNKLARTFAFIMESSLQRPHSLFKASASLTRRVSCHGSETSAQQPICYIKKPKGLKASTALNRPNRLGVVAENPQPEGNYQKLGASR